MAVAAARRELTRCAGGQFDPEIVRTFITVSLGRLWWKVGPVSWAAQLPFISLRSAGTSLAGAARAGVAAVTRAAFGIAALADGPGPTVDPRPGRRDQGPSGDGGGGSGGSGALPGGGGGGSGDPVGDIVGDVGGAVDDAADTVGDLVDDTMDDTVEDVEDVVDDLGDVLDDVVGGLGT